MIVILRNILLVGIVAVLFSGCASWENTERVDYGVEYCCTETAATRFKVEAIDIPAFLGPVMVSSFNVAMAERGFLPDVTNPQLLVKLRYIQVDVEVAGETQGELAETVDLETARRFVAKIEVLISPINGGDAIYHGFIQRLHDVGAGEFMHTGNASEHLLSAFNKALETLN